MFEIELIICIKMDLAFNNVQKIICYKNRPTDQPTNENEGIVNWFRKDNQHLNRDREKRIYPEKIQYHFGYIYYSWKSFNVIPDRVHKCCILICYDQTNNETWKIFTYIVIY